MSVVVTALWSVIRISPKHHFVLVVSLLAYLVLVTPAGAQDQTQTPGAIAAKVAALRWQVGPAHLHMAGIADLTVPEGYEVLTSPDANNFIALAGNPRPEGLFYILQPVAAEKNWFSVFEYLDEGHIDDSETIDAKALLANEKQSSEAEDKVRVQQGLPALPLLGWELQPEFNTYNKRLEWAYRFGGGDNITDNLNTRLLTRSGFFKAIVVTSPQTFASDVQDFNVVMNGISIDSGSRYSDYQSGDKLARYGLMGLIGGGAGAIAVKTGLFAAILAGLSKIAGALGLKKAFAALFVAIAALFRRIKKAIFRLIKRPVGKE